MILTGGIEMTTLTASTAKGRFLSLLRKTHDLGEKYTITHNGTPCAVLMSNDEYEGLLETLEILQDKNITKELLLSLQEANQGKTISFKQVVGRQQKK